MSWRCRRWAGGDIAVADPFLCPHRPAVLYVQDSMVHSHMLVQLSIQEVIEDRDHILERDEEVIKGHILT